MFCQSCENSGEVSWRLAFSEDDLRHACAQSAVVIHLGESQIFEGKMAQALDRFIGSKLAPSDLLEQFADGFGVHWNNQLSATGIRPGEVLD